MNVCVCVCVCVHTHADKRTHEKTIRRLKNVRTYVQQAEHSKHTMIVEILFSFSFLKEPIPKKWLWGFLFRALKFWLGRLEEKILPPFVLAGYALLFW